MSTSVHPTSFIVLISPTWRSDQASPAGSGERALGPVSNPADDVPALP